MRRNWIQKNWEGLKILALAILLAVLLSIQF
jgi:hypothetical protein